MYTDTDGYERFPAKYGSDVHHARLLAVAESGDLPDANEIVYRKNDIPWDLRPANIEVLSRGEWIKRHQDTGRDPEYDREELLSWIEAFVAEFGLVPSISDIRTTPGPGAAPYRRVFGSWTAALKAAGYTPRVAPARLEDADEGVVGDE